jgi:hypothetical protein
LAEIDAIQDRYKSLGMLREYNMEYMCKAEVMEEKSFKSEMFRSEPMLRTWQAVYTMTDPARSIGAKSATTGWAAWSWMANKLVIWEAGAKKLLPDEIVQLQFDLDARYQPALMGIEEDGLNEFLMQPIRHEQVKRGSLLPIKAMKAPKGKLDFIRALQPFFNAREVIFANDCSDLRSQLLSFPTGAIDAPNALAYALTLRPGAPMFEDFGNRNIAEGLRCLGSRTNWLAVNAAGGHTAAVLLQCFDGYLHIVADWLREGEPGQVLTSILKEANTEAGGKFRIVIPPQHFDRYTSIGLKQAITSIPMEAWKGLDPVAGNNIIRQMLRSEVRSLPAIQINSEARWTLNGFAGGYARVLNKQGGLAEFAEEGPYRTLMEAIASFMALQRIGADEEDEEPRYAFTKSGIRYRSALGTRS